MQFALWPQNSGQARGSALFQQKDTAAIVQRSRNQGDQCANPNPQFPMVSSELVKQVAMMSGNTACATMYSTGNLSTQRGTPNPEGWEKQLAVAPSWQQTWSQVHLSLSPVQWAEAIWDVLSSTFGYVLWNFEDLIQQLHMWDGSAWGLITNLSLLWRILVSTGMIVGLAFAGPALEAILRILQITWDVLIIAVRGIMGAAEELYVFFMSLVETIERVFNSFS